MCYSRVGDFSAAAISVANRRAITCLSTRQGLSFLGFDRALWPLPRKVALRNMRA